MTRKKSKKAKRVGSFPVGQLLSEVIAACVKRPEFQNLPPLTDDTRKILAKLYRGLQGPYAKVVAAHPDDLETVVKAPVLISFHPKLSLLNNNVQEALLAVKFAEALDQIPLWIPYVYDTATHSSAEGGKIRAPTYAYVEGSYIPLRSAAAIHGNIIKTEKAVQKREITKFMLELEKTLLSSLGGLQRQLNQYNFGHGLFDLKRRVMGFTKKKLRKELVSFTDLFQGATKGAKNLGEYLGQTSLKLFEKLDIPINLAFIEKVIPELVVDVFSQIIIKQDVQDDPSLLEGLFVHYNIKKKIRTPILYTGDAFIAIDDNANRHFDGSLEELAEELRNGSILPTGPSLILLFTALGGQVTLGGLHTQEYYPDYLSNATKLLSGTGFNSQMRVVGYGPIRMLDTRSMTDIMAINRIYEKVGSRSVVKNGTMQLPHDIVDHLHFLAGKENVPMEYHSILEELIKNQKESAPAIEKESARYTKISRWAGLTGDELQKELEDLKPYFRRLKLDELHPERVKIAVENLATDTELKYLKLKDNIRYEQHLLGGKLQKEEASDEFEDGTGALYNEFGEEIKFHEIFNGILHRSKRTPTLLEMALYGTNTTLPFQIPVAIKKAESPHYFVLLDIDSSVVGPFSADPKYQFSDFRTAFDTLVPESLIPKFFRPT